MEAIVLFIKAPKIIRFAKLIYGGSHLIYGGGWKMPASENRFTDARK
jgi:hypothetical protein